MFPGIFWPCSLEQFKDTVQSVHDSWYYHEHRDLKILHDWETRRIVLGSGPLPLLRGRSKEECPQNPHIHQVKLQSYHPLLQNILKEIHQNQNLVFYSSWSKHVISTYKSSKAAKMKRTQHKRHPISKFTIYPTSTWLQLHSQLDLIPIPLPKEVHSWN